MSRMGFADRPSKTAYDVVIVGGAIMGSATAWFLTEMEDFDGSVLVVERDPGYERCSSSLSASSIRMQFSHPLNIQAGQFTADLIANLRARLGGDPRIPDLSIQNYGYLYLADNQDAVQAMRENQQVQLGQGAATELLSPDEIAARYPFYDLSGILIGSLNLRDEGYWDGGTVFEWLRRQARARGVEYVAGEVVGMTRTGDRVTHMRLASGQEVACGHVVNASGPRAARTAAMAGLDLPVEPRKRFVWVFEAETPLDRDLPLTVDASGVYVRQDGPRTYLTGCAPDPDPAVDHDDFNMDHGLWQDHMWPTLAARIPQFEAIRVITQWAGHYAYNTLDQNAVLGPHPEVPNFLFQNGFSGHGLQQAPAMGRAVAEWIAHGEYRSLDMTPFSFDRVLRGEPIVEKEII